VTPDPVVNPEDVVMLIHWGQNGAGPRTTWELARAWNSLHPGRVAISFNTNSDRANDISALPVPQLGVQTYRRTSGVVFGLPRLLWNGFRLRRFIRRFNITTVVCVMESVYQSIAVPILVPRYVKYVCCIHDAKPHSGEDHWVKRLNRRLEMRRANVVVVFSEAVASNLVVDKRKRLLKTVLPAFRPADPASPSSRLLVPGKIPVIGFFGRLMPYKGIDLMLEAARILQDRRVKIRWEIYGSGPESILENHSQGLDVMWRPHWVMDAEIDPIFARFDILALPYREASQSGVLGHAMALGIPSVCTPVGGLSEQVHGAQAGIVARACNPESFADAVQYLLRSPTVYARISSAAIAASNTDYSWAQVVRDFTGIAR
jgi:glycosyltransferase involved in cell wall biosynthesis